MSQDEPNRPVAEFRVGGTITASVWRNEKQQRDQVIVTYSVTLQKRYFDKADQTWKTSTTFFVDELPRVQLALRLAYEWIMMRPRDAATKEPIIETEDVPI